MRWQAQALMRASIRRKKHVGDDERDDNGEDEDPDKVLKEQQSDEDLEAAGKKPARGRGRGKNKGKGRGRGRGTVPKSKERGLQVNGDRVADPSGTSTKPKPDEKPAADKEPKEEKKRPSKNPPKRPGEKPETSSKKAKLNEKPAKPANEPGQKEDPPILNMQRIQVLFTVHFLRSQVVNSILMPRRKPAWKRSRQLLQMTRPWWCGRTKRSSTEPSAVSIPHEIDPCMHACHAMYCMAWYETKVGERNKLNTAPCRSFTIKHPTDSAGSTIGVLSTSQIRAYRS